MSSEIIYTSNLKAFRKALRSESTAAEAILWSLLKNKQVGQLRFRRQYSENYILDFYCPAIKLAIELDGRQHNRDLEAEGDYWRDRDLLANFGIKTLRFDNRDVFDDPDLIISAILKHKGGYSIKH